MGQPTKYLTSILSHKKKNLKIMKNKKSHMSRGMEEALTAKYNNGDL